MNPVRELPSEQELASVRALVHYGTIAKAAVALCVSPHTVDTHLDKLRRKSGYRHLPQIIGWIAENGWLSEQFSSRAYSR